MKKDKLSKTKQSKLLSAVVIKKWFEKLYS